MRMLAFHRLRVRAAAFDECVKGTYAAIRREGMIHERVRLFRGAVFPWWAKDRSRLAQRVIEESAAHEETARTARLDAESVVDHEIRALLGDYRAALSALAQIAAGAADPMEVAARGLDAAEARMARFGPETPLDISLSCDASPMREALEQAQATLAEVNARVAEEMGDAAP